jgi:hypothetical protein
LLRRTLAQILGCLAASAVFATLLMFGQGCSARKSQIAQEPQSQQLPEVGTLDDYLASQDKYICAAPYGAYDQFTFDPLLLPPYWYPVPIYYLHRHHRPDSRTTLPVAREPIRLGGALAGAVRTAPTAPMEVPPEKTFGSRLGAVRGSEGFGYSHTGGIGHR